MYRVAVDAHTLSVRIDAQPCEDSMSGELFSHVVVVELDGRTLRGCGRVIGPFPYS